MWGSLSALKDAATTAVSDAASYAAPVLQEALGDVVNDEPRKDDDDGFIEDDGETDPTVLEVGCCRRSRCPRCGCQGVQCVCVCVCVGGGGATRLWCDRRHAAEDDVDYARAVAPCTCGRGAQARCAGRASYCY